MMFVPISAALANSEGYSTRTRIETKYHPQASLSRHANSEGYSTRTRIETYIEDQRRAMETLQFRRIFHQNKD